MTDEGRAWVARVYDQHGAEIFRFCVRLLRDRGLAEEATQDTFVKAWQARDRFEAERGSLRAWLFSIARNSCIDRTRARAVRPPLASADQHREQPSASAEIDRKVEQWHLASALQSLSDEHRVAIVEVHVRGRTCAEVAEQLGVPEGTVKSRIYHGLRNLRVLLREEVAV